jgi:hypothetical protein
MIDTTINSAYILQLNEQLRDLITRYAGPKNEKENIPVVKDELSHCIDCLLVLTAIFKALETCHPGYVFVALQSLLWGMPRNMFWKQHSEALSPLVNSGFNSYLTSIKLKMDQYKTPEKEALAEQERRAWIHIYPAAVGCMWGPERMMDNSSAMLQELYRIL